jgi:hypothetical protein
MLRYLITAMSGLALVKAEDAGGSIAKLNQDLVSSLQQFDFAPQQKFNINHP